jgi:trk system potassium uptake protein TrkH
MRLGNILQFIGWLLTVLAVAMIVPVLSAFADGHRELAMGFGTSALLTSFIGLGLVATFRGSPPVSTLNEGLVLVVLAWTIVPVFAGVPLAMADGIPTLLDAWFEAVSGLTTTGATLITDYEGTPRAIFLWRAILQWLGGLFIILMAMHILVVIGATLLPIKRVRLPSPDFVEKSEDLTNRIVSAVFPVAIIYVLMTLAACLSMWANGIPGWEALCLSMSAVSTGGFVTRAGAFDVYGSGVAEAVLVVVMILASMNFLIHWHGVRLRFREYFNVPELQFLAAIFAMIVGLVWLGFVLTGKGAGTDGGIGATLWSAIFNGVSLLSTTGFYLDEGGRISDLPPVLVMIPLMIGGAALSTTGGFKVVRFVLLIKHSAREMKRLGHPHGVFSIQFGDYKISEMTMDAVWALFLGFMSLTAFMALVVGWAGFDFEVALIAATAAVMNAGPFLLASTGGETTWAEMPTGVRTLLALGMIIGRVEVLAFFVLFNINFWRR